MTVGQALDFERYVESSRPALVRRAHQLTGEPQGAEDLVQTVLMKTFRTWDGLREPAAAHAYVCRALANQATSTWRRASHRREHCVVVLPEMGSPEPETPGPQDGPAPDERRLLWELVLRLPEQQRRAVVLRYYEDLSEAEAAEVLGVSVGTVKSNTSRGLRTLRQLAATAPLRVTEEEAP